MDRQLLAALKTLSDAPRLRIVGLLASGRRMAVSDLATDLAMPSGKVMHHLSRLSEVGLVKAHGHPPNVRYELRKERLAWIGARLSTSGSEPEQEGLDAPWPDGRLRSTGESRVLRGFLSDGRLQTIPAQEKKRLVVLRFLAETIFEAARDYPEKEVNQRLALLHPDVASLRRHLVDEGFMVRAAGIYRLRPEAEWPDSPVSGSISP